MNFRRYPSVAMSSCRKFANPLESGKGQEGNYHLNCISVIYWNVRQQVNIRNLGKGLL